METHLHETCMILLSTFFCFLSPLPLSINLSLTHPFNFFLLLSPFPSQLLNTSYSSSASLSFSSSWCTLYLFFRILLRPLLHLSFILFLSLVFSLVLFVSVVPFLPSLKLSSHFFLLIFLVFPRAHTIHKEDTETPIHMYNHT